jgi:hypothetical protein
MVLSRKGGKFGGIEQKLFIPTWACAKQWLERAVDMGHINSEKHTPLFARQPVSKIDLNSAKPSH